MLCAYHFKAKTSINHQQDKISDLGYINHRVHVVVTFHKCQTSLLATDNGDGALDLVQVVLGITLD